MFHERDKKEIEGGIRQYIYNYCGKYPANTYYSRKPLVTSDAEEHISICYVIDGMFNLEVFAVYKSGLWEVFGWPKIPVGIRYANDQFGQALRKKHFAAVDMVKNALKNYLHDNGEDVITPQE